ncbi:MULTISPECIES: glycoside hydrolase family 19 protein [unclassified Sphingomonas]|uniref:glycoside hydrolase family 19 protein n=1 Tax=unclassified Sphingomonas TaxID=196159 RepID=UPI002269BDDF|nr:MULTISPECIES: glycoside hydrolase family 19 protein [unclassified Sphingomonas]
MIDVAKLQRRVGVAPDGGLGFVTMTALFVKAGAPAAVAAELGIAAAVHFRTAGILDSTGRLAHAMAQVGHESDGFRAMEEYASGAAYEGRKDLGNTQRGDGVRYKGRGPIQVTGRANYRKYGRLFGIDLEGRPDLASVPSIGMMVSCGYWADHNLNAFADRDDVVGLTRAINGGTNGLDDRKARLAAMKTLLA